MNEYNISDYGIFSDAISTTTTLSSSVDTCQSSLKTCNNTINNESVFMGPIAEKCIQFLNNLSTDLDSVKANLGTMSNYLIQTSANYKAGDEAASQAQLKLDSATFSSLTSGGVALTGADNGEKIWNYLASQGMTQYAIAGIMGNLQQESNLRPDNVQNGMGYEDADYVAGIKSGEITREEFINDSRGFGLAQWTYHTRKAALYDTLGPENIDSLGGQLAFMVDEMGTELIDKMNNASSAEAATNVFQYSYERAGIPNMEGRIQYANEFYSKYTS